MKLTAPPPPPPPDDGNLGANAPGLPEEPNPNPGADVTAPAGQAPVEGESPAPVLNPLRWPGWYPGVDAALAGLALLLALATASFVARNSDVWLHLAAGNRLIHGEYSPGGADPFSFTGADRTWVNHSWVADAGAYLLYGGEGKLLVAVKSLLIVAAFALLIAIRRPQHALWPWAVATAVGVLAAAPYFTLRPHVLSIFFLALTLFILFRVPRGIGGWRIPASIGVTFWLWSNCDAWFLLGPLTLALLLAGELIQKFVLGIPELSDTEAEAESLGQTPNVAMLARALGVGMVVCMLNPHHVRVWQLPFELVGVSGAESDPRLRALLMPATDEQFYSSSHFGQNVNGIAFALLVVSGALTLGFSAGRLRASHVALWVGFLALAVYRIVAIPYFVVVAVPLIAAQLNATSSHVQLKTWGDPRSRFLWIGATVGRVLCVLVAVVLCVLSYPGWLQPETTNPAYTRRVAWGVEADPLLVQASRQLETWRAQEKLPTDDRGIIASTELANYVAWFAPREKVFINSNLHHHRSELPDYLKLRRGLGLVAVGGELPDFADAVAVMAQSGADYLAISDPASDPTILKTRSENARMALYRGWNEWTPWYLDGQTTVFGYRPASGPPKPEFAALRVDPVALAFGPNAQGVPDVELKPIPPALGWEAAFIQPQMPAPPGAAEALGWLRYKIGLEARIGRRQMLREMLIWPPLLALPTISGAAWLQTELRLADARVELELPPLDPSAAADAGAMRATPLLALWAALRGIEANPDHPVSYFALAEVLKDPGLPMTESERTIASATAYRQCLSRLPTPDQYRRGQFDVPATAVALRLAHTYLGGKAVRRLPMRGPKGETREQVVDAGFIGMPIDIPGLREFLGDMVVIRIDRSGQAVGDRVPFGQFKPNDRSQMLLVGPTALPLDAAYVALDLATQYAKIDFAEASADEAREELEKLKKEVQDALVKAHKNFDPLRNAGTKLPRLVTAARRSSLLAEALDLIARRDPEEVFKEFGTEGPAVPLLQIALELTLGKIEDADFHLNGPGGMASPDRAAELQKLGLLPQVRMLQHQKSLQSGQFRAAGELLEIMEKNTTPLSEILAEFARNKINPTELLVAAFSDAPPPSGGEAVIPVAFFKYLMNQRAEMALNARQLIIAKLQQESLYYFRRGSLLLLSGDIHAARHRFEQATRKPPDGWVLSVLRNAEADFYLRLIQQAERKPRP